MSSLSQRFVYMCVCIYCDRNILYRFKMHNDKGIKTHTDFKNVEDLIWHRHLFIKQSCATRNLGISFPIQNINNLSKSFISQKL